MPKSAAAAQLPLPSLIRASAWDAGNARMRKAGRSKWNRGDFNAAAETQGRLISACYGEGAEGSAKFGYAEAMQKAGLIWLGMGSADFFATVDASWAAYQASFAQAEAA